MEPTVTLEVTDSELVDLLAGINLLRYHRPHTSEQALTVLEHKIRTGMCEIVTEAVA